MKPIRIIHFRPSARVTLSILFGSAALTGLPAVCHGCDSAMICAWQRTFWAEDDLRTPLRGYFIPRRPNCACWVGAGPTDQSASVACDGIGPAEFIRLGKVPNDLQMLGAVGGQVGAPVGR